MKKPRMNFPHRKEQRHKEALERQAKYNSLSLEQKIAKATVGSKEHTKLVARQQKGAQ